MINLMAGSNDGEDPSERYTISNTSGAVLHVACENTDSFFEIQLGFCRKQLFHKNYDGKFSYNQEPELEAYTAPSRSITVCDVLVDLVLRGDNTSVTGMAMVQWRPLLIGNDFWSSLCNLGIVQNPLSTLLGLWMPIFENFKFCIGCNFRAKCTFSLVLGLF